MRIVRIKADGALPFLRFGDRVRIEMRDADGRSIFGAIDQEVARLPAGSGESGSPSAGG